MPLISFKVIIKLYCNLYSRFLPALNLDSIGGGGMRVNYHDTFRDELIFFFVVKSFSYFRSFLDVYVNNPPFTH